METEYKEGEINWDYYKKEWNKSYNNRHNNNYYESEEKNNLTECLTTFSRSAKYLPLFFKIIEDEFNGSIENYVDYLYKNSIMSNKKLFKRLLKKPSCKKLDNDPGTQMTIALTLYNYWLTYRNKIKPEHMKYYVYIVNKK